VYKYLCEANKRGVDADHAGPWKPDIVVGTSIGAVNGAAVTQGVAPDALERFWLSLREHDIQGLPPGMGPLARRVANMILKHSIGVPLARVPEGQALSASARDSWPPLPLLPNWLSNQLIGRWSNLLDTGPLYDTLITRLRLNEDAINASETTLLISATDVQTGQAVVFSNQPLTRRSGAPNRSVRTPITLRRIIASCSIPMVYPWTRDVDGAVYWDGAVVANTPLGPAFDVARDRPIDEPMEAVIVLMTPWWENDEDGPQRRAELPQDFGEAMTWTLDWALLASFRVDLKLARSYNQLALMAQAAGEEPAYRVCQDVIVAPRDFLPVARIIDYDEPASRELIRMGYEAAQRAFQAHFGA
jgi:NTE family protein